MRMKVLQAEAQREARKEATSTKAVDNRRELLGLRIIGDPKSTGDIYA